MNNLVITLCINKKEITIEQYNDIISFASSWSNMYGQTSISLQADKLPLRLKGKLSGLSSNARRYFQIWNKDCTIRNISAVTEE